jgi:hypothetical protein
MAKVKNTPTDEQIEYFYKAVEKYQSRFNLANWRIERGGWAGPGCMADVGISSEDRLAVVSIGKNWGPTKITESSMDSTAKHELIHILLKPLISAAMSRDSSLVDSEEHSLVVLLEKLL